MKTRKVIGTAFAAVGMFLAICVKDGSNYELAIRLAGLALMAVGVVVGRFYKD